ncbi:hypothetical protein M422DRAFT_263127 [Sphaerobolus stellatus SS14]|uniref:Uncharacterized protein n=1 Tax=Sphaerobolus stellatus (strain SS14) TaxID=990650 RepID=A0A0C9UIS0_SPHS4|nr:hypothetical protein M422DRAFT_263127 [Sphaerobolus stellatus SS14]
MGFNTSNAFKIRKQMCSIAQKAQTELLHSCGTNEGDKENQAPAVTTVKTFRNRIQNLNKVIDKQECDMKRMDRHQKASRTCIAGLEKFTTSMEKDYCKALHASQEDHKQTITLLQECYSRNEELSQKLVQAEATLQKSTDGSGHRALLKEKKKIGLVKTCGVVSDDMQALIRELVTQGTTPEHVYPVIKLVAWAFGLNLQGSFSACTITRIMIEGLVADDLYVVQAVQKAKVVMAQPSEGLPKNQEA